MQKSSGLERASYIYTNRLQVARELKMQGEKFGGYLCCYVPVEMLSAAGYVPFRIIGDMNEPITNADAYLPSVMCPFYRSCLDLGLKGKYDFLDGLVSPHACDAAERVGLVWRSYFKYPFTFYLDIPHTVHASALVFFKQQLAHLRKGLEEYTGLKITDNDLKKQIKLFNRQRELVRQLYHLRKVEPPPVSGTEVLQLAVSLMGLPVQEGNLLAEEVIKEVKTRKMKPSKMKGRVLVWGCLIDNTAITSLIEDCGLEVVMDDTAIGSRTFGHDVELTEDPLDGLALRYLEKIVCPRTFRETGKNRANDLENRFSYLRKIVKDWHIDGIYMNLIRNCDIHGYEVPEVRYFFEEIGMPVLVIEQDYSTAALAPLRTRFQAFAESIEANR
ncbi:2-hydroxyacyl-CoA dehydratase subunit D [Desulfotomaculum copahuensis]|uniref:2-hydroxyglutaryl-CoA dehydratase n=1 Tax=Desulfotomaculum copahuensis TaxID=1838280 RepID=A0A1B7LDN8_9FIRM|nr:2-hydroxyacyl-CoA dehydratase family protein [Desulfotomaculum copahuensis]OAT81226.1 hypothetical protein A6M21_00025 [Desulfotomaculum copahuensis]